MCSKCSTHGLGSSNWVVSLSFLGSRLSRHFQSSTPGRLGPLTAIQRATPGDVQTAEAGDRGREIAGATTASVDTPNMDVATETMKIIDY